ncbi:5'-3' exonuclease [Caldalkalibacillus mannanilyticus]|uniref:5'-3' exonuclease n=1 Tax=Caldalkalibacillus mannanilyticus TaxID=1418 RepID=UPI000468153A|nr:5'-3' exonuclease H3TH domain-containing protein [Caldalkalibacillus mannanilyticus]
MKLSNQQSVMLVDGMALLFRAYYASSYTGYIMKTSTGIPTNAVHGFVKYFWDAVQTFQPSHVVCVWDMGAHTFRTELYDQYKANRVAPPEELVPQFDLVKEVVDSFGVPNIGVHGYEADDCIGTLAHCYSQEMNVQILTGDHDSLQLLTDRINVIIMKKGMSNYAVYTPQLFLEEKGITPQQFIDLKGLMGDTSDNYPGVRGIGEKTALKLIQEHQSIEGVLDNLSSLSAGIRKKIEEDMEMLHLSRKLAEIRCDVPLEHSLEECLWELDKERVKKQFELLEFKNLMKLIS